MCEITKCLWNINPKIIMAIVNSNFKVRFSKHILLLYSYNRYIIIMVYIDNTTIVAIVVVRVIRIQYYTYLLKSTNNDTQGYRGS